MKIPQDATLDVQTSIREIIAEVEALKARWVLLNGAQLTGAGDANTATGLVTLRQLNALESRELGDIAEVKGIIKTLKVRNNLV